MTCEIRSFVFDCSQLWCHGWSRAWLETCFPRHSLSALQFALTSKPHWRFHSTTTHCLCTPKHDRHCCAPFFLLPLPGLSTLGHRSKNVMNVRLRWHKSNTNVTITFDSTAASLLWRCQRKTSESVWGFSSLSTVLFQIELQHFWGRKYDCFFFTSSVKMDYGLNQGFLNITDLLHLSINPPIWVTPDSSWRVALRDLCLSNSSILIGRMIKCLLYRLLKRLQ